VLWSALYYVFYNKNPFLNLFKSDFLDKLICGTASIQMYFIPSLILLYLVFPILNKYIHYLFKKWLIIVLTLIEIIFLFSDYYSGGLTLINPVRIALLNIYLFYVGIITVHKQEQILTYVKKYYPFIIGLLFISILTMFYESKENYLNYRDINFITSQWRASTLIYTLTLVGLLMVVFQNKILKFNGLLNKLSKLTLFVYFSHVFFISMFWRFIGSYLFSKSAGHIVENMFFDPLVFLFVASLSYLSAYIISYVPKLRWVLVVS